MIQVDLTHMRHFIALPYEAALAPRLLFVHAHPDDEAINTAASMGHYSGLGATTVLRLSLDGPVAPERPAFLGTSGYDLLDNVSVLEPKLILDTHDSELADDTLDYLRQWRTRFDKPGATLTYERDNNLDEASIARDLRCLRAVFCEEPAPCALTA